MQDTKHFRMDEHVSWLTILIPPFRFRKPTYIHSIQDTLLKTKGRDARSHSPMPIHSIIIWVRVQGWRGRDCCLCRLLRTCHTLVLFDSESGSCDRYSVWPVLLGNQNMCGVYYRAVTNVRREWHGSIINICIGDPSHWFPSDERIS